LIEDYVFKILFFALEKNDGQLVRWCLITPNDLDLKIRILKEIVSNAEHKKDIKILINCFDTHDSEDNLIEDSSDFFTDKDSEDYSDDFLGYLKEALEKKSEDFEKFEKILLTLNKGV